MGPGKDKSTPTLQAVEKKASDQKTRESWAVHAARIMSGSPFSGGGSSYLLLHLSCLTLVESKPFPLINSVIFLYLKL